MLKTPEDKVRAAKSGVWPYGITDFTTKLDQWRADGQLEGLEITAVPSPLPRKTSSPGKSVSRRYAGP